MKIGIIGCGKIATVHARSIRKIITKPTFYFCDVDISKAQKLANEFDSKMIYSDFENLLSEERLDAVHILTPITTHMSIAEKALNSGAHIYIEKPIVEKVVEYRKLLELADKEQKHICAGYSMLGMPPVINLSKKTQSGELGELISVHCDFMCAWPGKTIPYGDPEHWVYSTKRGILQNMADHPASLIVNSLDSIKETQIILGRRNVLPNYCPDLLQVSVQNEDQFGSFSLWMGDGFSQWQVQYLFEKGGAFIDLTKQLIYIIKGSGPSNFVEKAGYGFKMGWSLILGTFRNIAQVFIGKLTSYPGIANLINNFYEAINNNCNLLVSQNKVIETIDLLENVWNSFYNDTSSK